MKAARIAAKRSLEIVDVEAPMPAAGQGRVRLEGCGVCHSNLPVWEGRPWFNYPLGPGEPGHEGWGIIENIADDVTGFAPGERVSFLTNNAYAEVSDAAANQIVSLAGLPADLPFP